MSEEKQLGEREVIIEVKLPLKKWLLYSEALKDLGHDDPIKHLIDYEIGSVIGAYKTKLQAIEDEKKRHEGYYV